MVFVVTLTIFDVVELPIILMDLLMGTGIIQMGMRLSLSHMMMIITAGQTSLLVTEV